MPPENEVFHDATVEDAVKSLIVPKVSVKATEEPVKKAPEKPAEEEQEEQEEQEEEQEDTSEEEELDLEETDDASEEEEEGVLPLEKHKLKVKVDGEEVEVSVAELRDAYSGNKAIDKRLQQATEKNRALDEGGAALINMHQVAINKLTQIDEVLKAFAEPKINWEELRAKDPLQYAIKRDEVREAAEKRRTVQGQIEQYNKDQAALYEQRKNRYLGDQAEILVSKVPELADRETGPAYMGRLVKTAEYYGYTAAEVNGVMDHRAMLVLQDAMKYRGAVARSAAKKKTTPVKLVKTIQTTNSKPVMQEGKKKQLEAIKRARMTGKPEDVASLLIVKRPKVAGR